MIKYDEKVFLEELKTKAQRIKLNDELEKEIGYSDFIYNAYYFVKRLEDSNINYSIHHVHGGSSVLSALLGYEKAQRIEGGFIYTIHYDDEFDEKMVPTFTICVSKKNKDKAVSILDEIVHINFDISSYNAYFFGKDNKYHINILTSPFVDQLDELEILTGLDNDEIHDNDIETINYMLEEDDKGYFMPHLNGCIIGGVRFFYKVMEIVKPTSIFDLAKIECLSRAGFKDYKKLYRSLEKSGLEFTIYSREQLNYILTTIFDIDPKNAFHIIEDISHGKELLDSEMLTLQTYEVSESIINQIDNIRYLPNLLFCYLEMRLVYLLAYYKKHYPEEFIKVMNVPYKDSYVGPFFYIGNELYAHKEKIDSFNPNLRFFDSGLSHFHYFNTLNIDGDYGNFPRGRVMFDNYNKEFVIYIDKSLNRKEIKAKLIDLYHLEKEKTVFKYDSHYSHDKL